MKEKLFELLEEINQNCDTECEQKIRDFLHTLGAEQIEVSVDEMFDSCGLDVYSVSVAWIEGGKIQLAVGSIEMC